MITCRSTLWDSAVFFTDRDLSGCGIKTAGSGFETAAANLTAAVLRSRGEPADTDTFLQKFKTALHRPLFRLNHASALTKTLRRAGAEDVHISAPRKADIQELRQLLENQTPVILCLHHDAASWVRYVVCWGAECTTGGEAGDRWKFFVSDGRQNSFAETVLWDLRDARYMAVTASAHLS